VTSKPIKGDHYEKGQLVFYLRRENQQWIVDDIGFESPEGVKKELARFPKRAPKAKQTAPPRQGQSEQPRILEKEREVLADRLEKLGISKTQIQIEARLLTATEDFLEDMGLDANSVQNTDTWLEPVIAEPTSPPTSPTYTRILDDLHVTFLLKAVQAHKDAHLLAAPRIMVLDGETASVSVLVEGINYISGYTEPNRPSDEPQPKTDCLTDGFTLQLTPKTTSDEKHITLNMDFDLSNLLGFESHMYKGKYPYETPHIEKVSLRGQVVLPDGKTLLIGGPEITPQVRTDSGVPMLGDLPVIGKLFRSENWTDESRILLILIKPTVVLEEQSEARRTEEADSEHL